MEPILIALGLGSIGGFIRNMRDTYKRYMSADGKTLNDVKKYIEVGDLSFDLLFGIVVASLSYLATSPTEFSNFIILGLIGIGYAGADGLDPLLKKK